MLSTGQRRHSQGKRVDQDKGPILSLSINQIDDDVGHISKDPWCIASVLSFMSQNIVPMS